MPGGGASARKRRGGASWLLLWSCWTHVSHSTLVAHYSFDDGTATEDSDSSLDGTITGATATTGLFGSGALAFDGSDDYVAFPSAVTADILGSDARTICVWAVINAFNDGGLFEYGSSAPDQAFAIRTAGDSSVYVELYGSGAVPTSDATDGDWHHYCLTYHRPRPRRPRRGR